MTRHWVLVTRDEDYIARFGDDPDDPATKWTIECSDPSACEGWEECPGEHGGFDPNDEDSPAFDEYEDVEIHGVPHEWRWGYGWTVPYAGCPVMGGSADDAPAEVAAAQGVGRWEVDADWDDTDCYLILVPQSTDQELPTPTTDYPGDAGVLDTMVEHGDHYAGRPELHIGFRHQGDDE